MRGAAIIRKGKRVRKFKRGLLLCGFHSTGNARPCQTGAGLRVLRLIKTYTVCALCGKQAGFSPLSESHKKPVFARVFGCLVRFSTGRKCALYVPVFSGWVCSCFFGCMFLFFRVYVPVFSGCPAVCCRLVLAVASCASCFKIKARCRRGAGRGFSLIG